jgi:hypothetical protein
MTIFGSVGRVQSRYNFSNEKSLDCLRSVSFFHRITAQKNHSIGGDVQKVQGKFNTFNWFESSIPLHFDMLNATPYSLSKEGNLVVFIYFLYINYVRWGQSRYNFSNEKSLDWWRCSKVQGVQRKFKMFKEVQKFKKSSRVQIKQKKSTRLCSFLAFWT